MKGRKAAPSLRLCLPRSRLDLSNMTAAVCACGGGVCSSDAVKATLQTNRWPSSPLSFHSRKWLLQIEIELILESNCITVAESLLLKFEWAPLRYCIHPPSDLSFFSSWTPAEWPCIMNHLHIHKPPRISRKGHHLQPPAKMFSASSLIVFGQNLEGDKNMSQKVKCRCNCQREVTGVTSQRAVSHNLVF